MTADQKRVAEWPARPLRPADPDGRDRRLHAVRVAVALADGPRDGAQAAAEQVEETALAAVRLALVVVILDLEARLRPQRYERAVAEAELARPRSVEMVSPESILVPLLTALRSPSASSIDTWP